MPTDKPGNAPASGNFSFGPFRLSASERLLQKEDEPLQLGGRALDILLALVENSGQILSRRELMQRAWPDVTVEETNLRVHIASLRKVLGDSQSGGARYIVNVPGRGYCFIAPVQSYGQDGPRSGKAAQPAKAATLPARLQRMVGREEAVATLRSEVSSKRFISIVGPGGMGKTTLAVAVAHEMAAEFGDAVHFVDLSSLHDGALVVPSLAAACGCLGQTQDSLSRLVAFLADKKVLVVLDSCEHVIADAAALAEQLFADVPGAHIIATSREALRVEGENIHPLTPLGAPLSAEAVTAVEALTFPAVRLFMDRAAAGGHRHQLTDQEAPVVARICRQLDGMPLAIELTASRCSTYGIGGLAQLISDRLTLQWQGRRSAARHQTLGAALDWSYNLLSATEKTVLCRLSVFVGAFSPEMAQAVVGDLDLTEWHAADVIAGLVDKSLVSTLQSGGQTRYRLLDTTRAYAAIRLAQRSEDGAIARRHALHFAEELATLRASILQERNLTVHTPQLGNVRAALEWCFSPSGDTTVGVALGAGAVPLFLGLSMLSECLRWCRKTLDALDEEDRGTRLELVLQLSLAISSTYVHGNSEEVKLALENGLRLADTLGDLEFQLHFLAGLNLFRTRLADFGGALEAADRYAVIAEKLGNQREIVAAAWMLGATHHLVGNQASAHRNYEAGFERAAAAGIEQVHSYGYDHQVRALIGFARTLWLRGHPDRALQFAQHGIEVAARQDHPVTLCICLLYATPVFLWRGDQQMAGELIEQLMDSAAKHSLGPYHAGGLGLQGELLLARGETTSGIDTLRTALLSLRNERQFILYYSLSRALAEGLARSGQATEATEIIEALVAEAGESSGTFEMPDLLRIRAEVLMAASPANRQPAEASLVESLNCARQQSALGWELRSAMAICRLWADQGRFDEARTLLKSTLEQFTEGFETADLRKARHQIREIGGRL